MTGQNMKRLGDYIRPVDVRNRDLKVERLLGISVTKEFIPSIANTIGTDMSSYKIVYPNQFVYIADTSRRGDKIAIAYLKENEEPALVSAIYTVFEVVDTNALDPEYLMMWFRRPEFDRYARFHSHGSAREVFDWEEMCEVQVPVPAIEKQREIVAEYNTLATRIETNKNLIATLEQTAQTLYRHTFVDNIDPNNLPEGWRMGTVGELFELQRGFDLPTQNRENGEYPIYASTGIAEYHKEYKVKAPGIVTGRSGSIGEIFYVDEDFWPLNTTLWVKEFKKATPFYAYYCLENINLETLSQGSAVPTLNRNDVHAQEFLIPDEKPLDLFECQQKAIFKHKKNLAQENQTLTQMQTLLLSKMGA